MDKAEFLSTLSAERAAWDALLAGVPPAQMLLPGACGPWTLKDVIAHVTWGEREMIGVLRQRALAGSPLWDAGQAERNQAVYLENRDRPLADVLAGAAAAYRELLPLLEELPAEAYRDPSCFRDMPAEWEPWQVLYENTTLHYRDHAPGIRAWLAGLTTADAP